MSLGLTYYSAERMLNKLLGIDDYTPAATNYFGAFTANPADAEATSYTECTDGGYARVSKTNNDTTWTDWAGGAKVCGVEVSFAAATEDWTELTGIGIWDASTAGNLLGWGALASPITLLDTEVLTIPADAGQFTFLGDASGYGGLTDLAAAALMDYEFGISAYTEPATCYFGFLTTNADPDGTGSVELGSAGYARVSKTNNTTTWPGWAAGITQNGVAIAVGPATEDWTEVLGLGIWDAASAGNLWIWGKLTSPKSVLDGQTETVPVGAITVRIQ